jgi:hypothetical protein
VACLIGTVGEVQVDIGSVKDPAYRTMDFRVAAKEKSLQSHTLQRVSKT